MEGSVVIKNLLLDIRPMGLHALVYKQGRAGDLTNFDAVQLNKQIGMNLATLMVDNSQGSHF